MTAATKRLPSWAKREFERSQHFKECQAAGYHVRSGVLEIKTMGGHSCPMELCAFCDVWLEQMRPDWKVA